MGLHYKLLGFGLWGCVKGKLGLSYKVCGQTEVLHYNNLSVCITCTSTVFYHNSNFRFLFCTALRRTGQTGVRQ
jgi:hypothetical protein